MKSVKIAILNYYSGVVDRGVETFAYEIGRRLVTKHLVTLFHAGPLKPQKFRTNLTRAFATSPKSSKGFLGKIYFDWQSTKILLFTLKLLPALIKGKYKLIIPLNGGWQTVISRLISKLIGAKLLISGHAGIGSDDAWNLLWRPDVFVALTQAERNWAKKLVPEVRVEVIPNGVDLSRFNPKVLSANVNLQKPIVVCASALVPYKRVDLTVRAVAKAKNLSLLILGNGELAGTIDTLGKRLLGTRYRRMVVPYHEIPAYYRAADVFTLASKTEAFGISYIEAMACNLSIVTTADNSRAEIIGDAGILTDPANIEQYARDLGLATNINWRNIPYTQALKFSWNKVTEKYSDLIDEVITT